MRRFYLRDNKNFPVACVVTFKALDSDLVHFGVSSHNPEDKFNRHEAVYYAAKNMEEKETIVTFGPGVRKRIVNFIKNSDEYSHRARKAAELWLKNYEASLLRRKIESNFSDGWVN